jgi:hypothetical protein
VSDDARLGRLRQIKLAALVEGRWGPSSSSAEGGGARLAGSWAAGATLLDPAAGRGWVLDDGGSPAFLSAALVWARRQGVKELHLIIDPAFSTRGSSATPIAPEAVARRAALWAAAPQVWAVSGRDLRPAEPEVPAAPIEPPAAARAWIAPLVAHGTEVVLEHGVIAGEVRGLEVARVVPSSLMVGLDSDSTSGWQVAVGVGHHDREARDEMHPGEPLADSLDRVVSLVRRLRVAGAVRHPANTLAREGWLRSVLVARPGMVGAAELFPVPPPRPRVDLRRPAPAPAAGVDLHGAPMVVVASVGVDLDFVPAAAEARLSWYLARPAGTPPARLVLVVPQGDDYPVTRELAAELVAPAEIVTVPRDWDGLALP